MAAILSRYKFKVYALRIHPSEQERWQILHRVNGRHDVCGQSKLSKYLIVLRPIILNNY